MALTTITKEMVSVNAIQGTLIADNAITAVHIATNAVSGTLVADNAITATHIAQNVITVTQLADDAVEAAKIADGVITTNHLNKAMISSQTEVSVATGDFILLGDTSDSNNLKKAPISSILAGTLTTAAQGNITSLGTLTTLTVDDITINGSTISDAGSLTVDIGGTLILDADDGDVQLKDGGTQFASLYKSSNDFIVRSMISDGDFKIQGNDGGSTINALTLDMSAAGAATFNSGVVTGGPLTLGDYIEKTSGNLTLDVAGDIILDADGGEIEFKDGGTTIGFLSNSSSDFVFQSAVQDKDIIFKGDDGGSGITALTLDMSEAGYATFNNYVKVNDRVVGNSNLLLVTHDSNEKIHMDASGYIKLETAGTERMRIDSSGNVLVGHTASITGVGAMKLQVSATDATGSLQLGRWTDNNLGSYLSFVKSRNGTIGSSTVVQDGDALGQITWSGDDGTDFNMRSSAIYGRVDGTPGSNDMPGRLEFITTPDGAAFDVTNIRMVIKADGKIGIGTTSPAGILHVDEGAADDARIIAETHAGGDSMILFSQGASGAGSPTWGVGLDATNDVLSIGFEDTGYDDFSLTTDSKLVIDTSGNVGIGTTSPSQKLYVSGNLQVPDANTIYAGNIYIAGRMGHKDDQYAYIDWSTNTMDLAANVIKLKGGSTTGLQELYFNNGQMTLADDASYTISSARNTGVIIIVGSSKSSGGTTYDTAMFFGDYGTNELVEIADPSSKWSIGTSTDGVANIGISGNSDVVITNKVGNSSNFSIAVIRTQGL